jgi:nicotinate-nucleotide adenylyltransferase
LRARPSPGILLKMSISLQKPAADDESRRSLSAPSPAAGIAHLPPHAAGMRIGLFGGSFNPPHQGHLMASMIAMRRLGLDRVWWVVTPGNPLKENSGLPTLASRIAAARAMTRDPRIAVTGFEAEIGVRYTYDTISYLCRRCPDVRFVWIMGADNLASFHKWQRWQEIARMVGIVVVDRPGSTLKAAHSRAGHWLRPYRVPEESARLLTIKSLPAFVFLHGPRSDLSSTALRSAGHGVGQVSRSG